MNPHACVYMFVNTEVHHKAGLPSKHAISGNKTTLLKICMYLINICYADQLIPGIEY